MLTEVAILVGCIVSPVKPAKSTNCGPGRYPSVDINPGSTACVRCPSQLNACENAALADRGSCRNHCAAIFYSSSTTNPSFSKGTFPTSTVTTRLQRKTTKANFYSSSTTNPSFSKGTFLISTLFQRKTTKGPFRNSTNQRSTQTTPSIYLANNQTKNNEEDNLLVVGLASGFSVPGLLIFIVILIYCCYSRKRRSKKLTMPQLTSRTGINGTQETAEDHCSSSLHLAEVHN